MSPVYLGDLGFQRNQPEDREGLARTRRPGRGHLGHSGGWQNNEGDDINLAIHAPFQQEPQTRGLERHGSSSSAPPTPQRFLSMEHGQQEVLTRSRPNQLYSGFTPFTNQKISGQESPFFTIPGSFQEKTRKQGQKQDLLQPEEERVRPHDPEAVGFGERSAQEPEVVVYTSRISSPIDTNITPTQIGHNFVTPESNLNSNAL
ncbi:hypothetical protein O181_113113 [Austropuccinia psidii MF-1]|uniref:Uncharacterized protein n=1 Tax=Austropuccinia psidii MF-1 TaxID=1389203 RepID=A0A9Q3K1S6_9BASI|nr:hypothetical protein [Austropuccinia psidii MF-1]